MNLSIRQWLAGKFITNTYRESLKPSIVSGIALRIINEIDDKSLTCFDICSLAEVLELPINLAWQEIPIIIQLTQSLLSNSSQRKPLKRNEGTWQGFQIAYLLALLQILEQEIHLKKPWLNRAMFWSDVDTSFSPHNVQLQGFLKTLQGVKLTDTQAEQALLSMSDSFLAQQMNNATASWLRANGAEESEAKLMIQRISHALPGHLLEVITQNAAGLAQLQKFVRLQVHYNNHSTTAPHLLGAINTNKSLTVYAPKIDLHCEQYRASLIKFLALPLFLESFSLKDIYVPPKGLALDTNNQYEPKALQPFDLTTWLLEELENSSNIIFIEADAGNGKTSFCQMLAAKVAQEIYPDWMPVLIRLRDVSECNTFIETICSALPNDLSTHLAECLNHGYLKCLLILDGLNELPITTSKTLQAKFIEQLFNFQLQTQHKVIVTSRPIDNRDIANEAPLQRIKIQPFEQEQLRIWFQKWTAIQSAPIAQNFFIFLKKAGLFSSKSKFPELAALVRKPLTLYLLSVLYRDGLLEDDIVELAQQARETGDAIIMWEIYQRLNRWLLGYPLTGGTKPVLIREGAAHIHRTQDAIENLLQNRHPRDIHSLWLSETLKILHSPLSQQIKSESSYILPAFYFDSYSNTIKFSHPKLGELLCADAIATQLKLLTQRQRGNYGELNFLIDTPTSIAQHVYNLFGYGIINSEIGEFVIEALRQQEAQGLLSVLCDRLLIVWHGYCQGRWLDEGVVHNARIYYQQLHNPLTIEQINAAVGANLFFLLCDCHRLLQRAFSPCYNPQVFAQLISRTNILAPQAFCQRITRKTFVAVNLSNADLRYVSLTGVSLEGVNLAGAKLTGANLAFSNLSGANLTNADLKGANLECANLTNTKISFANLERANLTGIRLASTVLTNACLYNAILSEQDKETVRLQGAMFAPEEYRALKLLLAHQSQLEGSYTEDSAIDTNIWFNEAPEIGMIESVEGEMLSEGFYDSEIDDETFVGSY
jgi:uncharacterized protein YjbI with pentapeptide repeats